MIVNCVMDEQRQPLMAPFKETSPENGYEDKDHKDTCYNITAGSPTRAKSIDYTGALNTRSDRKVITKSSSSHKFTIINYGRSSIPSCSNPSDSNDNLCSTVHIPEENPDCFLNTKDTDDEICTPAKTESGQSSSSIVNITGQMNDEVDGINEKSKKFLITMTPNSQKVSLRLPEYRKEISSPFDQSGKNSLTPFLTTDQSLKYPNSQQSYWKNKTSRWSEIAKIGRIFSKRNKLRLIQQSGECNVMYSNIHRKSVRYLTDLFTTLMELKWRYNILFYLVSFIMSWILFALLWWSLHCIYGLDENEVPCVEGVKDFKTALLFSIETQQTIGYGSRSVTDRCLFSYFLLMLQSVFGAITQCIVTGIVFSKLARPDKRAETVIFSKKAVICKSSNKVGAPKNLEFRIGDIRNSQLIGVRINAILVTKDFKNNGEQVELQQKCLKITTESEDDFYFLAWPIKVIHRIDHSSPFWDTSAHYIALADFEILIVLEANCESTGGTVQVKTSYLPSEIVCGSKLAPLFTRTKFNGRYKVDYSRFNEIIAEDDNIYNQTDHLLRIEGEKDVGRGGTGGSQPTANQNNNMKVKQDRFPIPTFKFDEPSL